MRRTVLALLLAGSTIGPVLAQEVPNCDLRVTRVRNYDHMDCYLRLGPKSQTFSHTNTAQLDELSSCIDTVDREYKLARYLCSHAESELHPLVRKSFDLQAVREHYKFQ